jgi:NAD(P)-dependent dehydrogenase (short-subunit alcohol dehydrogenase family)
MAKRGSSKANSALHGRDSPGFPGRINFNEDEKETPETVEHIKKALVSGRLATVDDIVGTIAFLASPASQWLSAQTIFVNNAYLAR